MEKPLNFRTRIVDTITYPESMEQERIKPMTEHVDFYTQAGTYIRGLRHLEKENTVIVGELEPLIK